MTHGSIALVLAGLLPILLFAGLIFLSMNKMPPRDSLSAEGMHGASTGFALATILGAIVSGEDATVFLTASVAYLALWAILGRRVWRSHNAEIAAKASLIKSYETQIKTLTDAWRDASRQATENALKIGQARVEEAANE
jgi:hypothetical protein